MRALPIATSLLAGLTIATAAGCIVEAPTSEDLPARRRATVERVPAAAVRNGAVFDDKLELVGAEFTPGALKAGDEVRVTVFYKVLAELDADYEVFVHAEDPAGVMKRFVNDHPPAGGGYPASRWRKGETIRDTYSLRLPSGALPRAVDVWTGMWNPKTERRMRVGEAQGVRHDGENRVLLIQLPVSR